jgi:hypothetical protein
MTTATKAKPKKAAAPDHSAAQTLMQLYAQSVVNRKALLDRIKNELDAYNANIKESEAKLIEYGTRHRHLFDPDGNLHLGPGYLHAAATTVTIMGRTFDPTAFAKEFPELIDIKLRTAPVKKAFLDKATRRELKAMGVDLTTEEQLQVLLHKA